DLFAQLIGETLPTVPIVLRETILKASDRPLLAFLFPVLDQLVRADHAVGIALEEAVAFLAMLLGLGVKLGRRRVQSKKDLLAERIARLLDRRCNDFERFVVAL